MNEKYAAGFSDFIPASETIYQYKSKVDLRDSAWEFCQFRFRGLAPEIEKLRLYLREHQIQEDASVEVSEQVIEIRVFAGEKTPDLVEKFPALKVTGLAEHWWRQEVYIMYSESGFAGITQMQVAGSFDRRHESGDGRWEWEYDMMEPVRVQFTWLQTGEEERVSYRYPFASDWNWSSYALQIDGTIYVERNRFEKDFEIVDGVLKAYHGLGGDVVIPDTVRQIGEFCQVFSNNSTITSVQIPGSIKRIPAYTFSGCINLQRVVFEEGTECVELHAFMDCSSLTELVLPESLVSLIQGAFLRCGNLDVSRLKLPSGLRRAGQAFRFCKNVPKLLLNEDQTILLSVCGSNAPYELVVPESVTTIGPYALWADQNLTSVRFSGGLRQIGEGAFRDCGNLVLKDLPDTLEAVGACAFSGCGEIDSLTLPESVKCLDLHTLGLPVKKVRLNGGIKEVPGALFSRSLYSGTVTNLNCAPDPRIVLSELSIGEGTRALGDYALMGCANLVCVDLPETLETIGNHAFACCNSLPGLKLPEKLKSIGAGAFTGCGKFQVLEIPEHIEVLEEELLRDCTGLLEISLPEKLQIIGKKALRGCTSLEQITIGDGVTEIREAAFLKCSALRAISLPQSLRKLEKEAFRGCTGLKELTIPAGVSEVSLGLAQECKGLQTVRIESGVQKIAGRSFRDCARLQKVEIPSTVTKIGVKAFEGCPEVTIFCEKGSAAETYARKNNLQLSYI